MYGTSEDRRFMGPAGSQTHTHHNTPLTATNFQNLSTHQTVAAAAAVAAAASFPTFFPPLTHFQHLAALHTSLTANTINTDLILNQTNAHTTNLWPTSNPQLSHTSANAVNSGRLTPFDFHVNGQVTDSLFAARNFNTPPVSAPYLPVTSLNLVAKNFQETAAATQQFSQAKSLLLQSQTDYFGNTFSTTKKSETCYSRWQAGQQHQPQSAFEPLQIQVPPIANIAIKSESIGSKLSLLSHQRKPSKSSYNSDIESNELTQIVTGSPTTPTQTTSTTTILKKSALEFERQTENSLNSSADSSKQLSVTSTLSTLPLANTTERSTSSVANTQSQTKTTGASHSVHDITSGCSRTVPLFWNNLNAATSLLQIKREPCQVSEITTSNSIQSIAGIQQQRRIGGDHRAPIIKIEAKSPTETTPPVINSIPSSIVNMDQHSSNQVQSGAIPVGIAVARQRLQEHHQQQHQHQPKEINRFGNIGISNDLGGATSAFTHQNMLFTGPNQTMIPFNSDVATTAVSMGVSGAVQGAVRTPPTLWQYPAPVPMESMLPHVPFQLLRDPNSGQFLFFPTAATSIEPFQHHQQQTVVWPTTYTQPQTTIQAAPHLLMPPIAAAQTMQAPSLTPLLLGASDYLSGSTTLHQHTQTHSTRLVALSSDNNNKRKNNIQNQNIPLSMSPHPTLIKIEDSMSTGTGSQCNTVTPYEPKSQAIQTATITAAVQTNDVGTDIAAQLNNYYQAHGLHGNLIQLAPHTSSVPPTQSLSCSTGNSTITASIPFLNAFDCRHMQSQTMPNILTPPDVTISTMSCLTPISETYSRSEENLNSTRVIIFPEVQDATIQTDTPIMSEDDNTNGADDSAYSSNIIINSNSDGLNISIPTTTSCSDICHSISNISETSVGTSPPNSPSYAVSCRVSAYSNDMIHSSSSNEVNVDHGLNHSNDISTSSELNQSNEYSFETAVSSTNMIEEEHLPCQPTPEINNSSLLSLATRASNSPHEMVNSSNIFLESVESAQEKPIVKSSGPDLSGLELLSNSIEAFEKRPFIKQEPIERMPELSPAYSPKNNITSMEEPRRLSTEQFETSPRYEDHNMAGQSLQSKPTFVAGNDQLGGLNLLCALAEQHFQEEVGNEQRAERKRSMSSSDGSESKRAKKHKEKKAKKKERKEKERKERHNSSGSTGISSTEDAIEHDFKETFDRIKEKYAKCDCKQSSSIESCCCKMKWPTPEEVYVAMKSEMRHQLAEIKRKVKEEERKLESINSKESRLQRESTPSSLKSSGSSSKLSLGSMPSAFSPSILSSSSLEQGNVEFSSGGKIHSDTESCSSTSSKPKLATVGDNIEFQRKKNKSLVGYIFASKKRINDSRFDSTTDETSLNSDISAKLKRNVNAVKQEVYDFDESVAHPEMKLFGNFLEENRSKNHLSSVIGEGGKLHKLKPSSLTKHVKKLKNEKDDKHLNKELERKWNINAKCLLTAPHLDTLTENKMLRVLTAMGGLFYAGCLTAIRAPDLYGVTLDGERGNKAHIMSREDILRDAILEVAPNSTADTPPGTRICAYWSQQYRCLYPGTVAISTTPDYEADDKYAVVEFDDGDSGRIALEDIRFLTCDYPVIVYDPNPLQSLGKRTKTKTNPESTDVTADQSTAGNCFSFQPEPNNHLQSRDDTEAYKERRRLKRLRKDKLRQLASSDPNAKRHKHKHKSGDELCKHRKHKKRRKHKKHHNHEENMLFESTPTADDDHSIEEDVEMEEIKPHKISVDKPNSTMTEKNNLSNGINLEVNKLQWPLDEDLVSSITEDSSGSSYNPGKSAKERISSTNEKHSKIAAFLPARQLWAWFGKGYKRNAGKGARNKKVFYKTIQRGKETISVGDSAVFLSTGRPDRPYIGRIESLWESSSNNRVVKVKWYYHPEETTHCPDLMYPGALFESPHEDENDVQTISHKCKVLPLSAYTKKYGPDPKKYSSVYDNNDTFYLAGYYDPTVMQLKMEKDIPTVSDSKTDAIDNVTNQI